MVDVEVVTPDASGEDVGVLPVGTLVHSDRAANDDGNVLHQGRAWERCVGFGSVVLGELAAGGLSLGLLDFVGNTR